MEEININNFIIKYKDNLPKEIIIEKDEYLCLNLTSSEEESDEYDEWGMSIDNDRNLGQGFFNLFNENDKIIDEDIWYELDINEKELENKILVGNVENLIINKLYKYLDLSKINCKKIIYKNQISFSILNHQLPISLIKLYCINENYLTLPKNLPNNIILKSRNPNLIKYYKNKIFN